MKLTDLLGKEAKTFIDFVEWLFSDEGTMHQKELWLKNYEDGANKEDIFRLLCYDVQQFLSQPFTIDMVVRPEQPHKDQFVMVTDDQMQDLKKWQNWKPLFEGEWERVDFLDWCLKHGKADMMKVEALEKLTIDEFIRFYTKQGITLTYNPEYELQNTRHFGI